MSDPQRQEEKEFPVENGESVLGGLGQILAGMDAIAGAMCRFCGCDEGDAVCRCSCHDGEEGFCEGGGDD